MNTVFRLSASLFLSSLSLLSAAQESDSLNNKSTMPSQTLSEVVISANRYGSPRMKTPEAIRIVDGKTIQKFQLRTAPEALTKTPGVFVQKTNHGGGSPFLRGLTGNQTLLMVDGIRLSNSTMRYGPNQYFNTIDVFSVEKIEVLRGSGSVQYGSDAIGGTIHAFSYDPDTSAIPSWRSSLLTRFATSRMEQSIRGGINYSNKRSAFRGGVTWRNFGDLIGGDTTGRQAPTGYGELDFDIKGKIHLSSSSLLTMVYQNVHQSHIPVFHKVVLENYAINEMDPQNRELVYLRLNQKFDAGVFKSAVFTASYQHSEEGRLLRKNGSSVLRTENDRVRTMSFSAEALSSGRNGWSANTGIEIYNDLVSSSRLDKDLQTGAEVLKRGLYPDGAAMTSIAAFSMHSFDLPEWNFTVGGRFNSYIIKVYDEAVGATTLSPSALVGNMSVMKKLTRTSNLFVSVNSGFRAPNVDDLGTLGIVDFRYETPNFELKPEHSFQYQAGYKFRNSKLSGEIYIYRNELYDLIVRSRVSGDTIDGYPVYRKENLERAYIHGLETAFDLEISRSLSLSMNMTYTYGQNVTKSEPARRIPPLFGRLALDYKYKDLWINLEYLAAAKQDRLAAGDRDDNRIPAGGTPGWEIFNISTGYNWRFIQADLSINNIFNQDYRFHGSGVNGIGRSAFLTVKISL